MPVEIYNSDNTEIIDVQDARFISEANQIKEREVIHAKGKHAVIVCCFRTYKIIKRALEFGLSRPDLELLLACFNHHTISDFLKSKYRFLPGMVMNIDGLINDIFNKAFLFDRPVLQKFFLESVYDDVLYLNIADGFSKSLKEFKQKFKVRKASLEKEYAISPDLEVVVSKDVVSEIFHREYKQFKEDLPYSDFQRVLSQAQEYVKHIHEMKSVWSKAETVSNLRNDRDVFVMMYEKWTGVQQPDSYYPKEINVRALRASEKLEAKAMIKVIDLMIDQLSGDKPSANETLSGNLEEILRMDNKFLKGLSISVVYDHFKVFTDRKSKNGRPFLTHDQLLIFLQMGFIKREGLLRQKFNHEIGEKGFLIKRFYQFFVMATTEYSEISKKERYIQLIADCFDNWESKTITAYFRNNKTKKEW